MTATVPPRVYELIKKVVSEDVNNFSISVEDANKKGRGYLGEIFFVSLQNKKSGRKLHFVIKQSFSDEFVRSRSPIKDIYLNEIYFYTKLWPSFQIFQKKIPAAQAFNKIVKCLATTDEDGFEKIVLENIKFDNFRILDKKYTFDREHIEYVLKQYGKFHALSFAYRALDPEGYSKLSEGLKDIYLNFAESEQFGIAINVVHELCLDSLQPGKDDAVIQKYRHYLTNGIKIFADSNNYNGNYSAILHGDCWSNNMMFKYDESGKLADMRFLDFQLCKDGTPVIDLAYFLYSGGSKEILDELDYFLRVYHNSLLETVELFGVNSENIYPFEVLKNDWKEHCQLGVTMALFLWKEKVTNEENIVTLSEIKEDADTRDYFLAANYDKVSFKKRTRELILHLYENNYLIN